MVIEPRETCLRCGYYEQRTIDTTWSLRAAIIALGPARTHLRLFRRPA